MIKNIMFQTNVTLKAIVCRNQRQKNSVSIAITFITRFRLDPLAKNVFMHQNSYYVDKGFILSVLEDF